MISSLCIYKIQVMEYFVAEEAVGGAYYAYAMKCGNRFIASWFEFSLNVNNILAAFILRKYKMEVASRIVGDTESVSS